jgi:hypothetical protein
MSSQSQTSRLDTYRSGLKRKGASDITNKSSAKNMFKCSLVTWIWIGWGVGLVSVSLSFTLIYYFQQVNSWRGSITDSISTAAVATTYDFFVPLWGAVDAFDNAVNGGGITGVQNYSIASISGYPLFKQFSTIQQVELYLETSVMRLRPSVGSFRVDACDNKYPAEALGFQLTNVLEIPLIYITSDTNCLDDQNYCRYGLVCESESSLQALVNETLNGPLLFIPPEASTVTLDLLSISYSLYKEAVVPIRSVIELASLTTTLASLYSDYRVIVMDSSGNGIATSQPSYYKPFSISISASNQVSLQLTTNVYDLDPMLYPWVLLMPSANALASITYPFVAYDSVKDWSVQLAKVDEKNAFYVIVASQRSDFTYGVVFALGISIVCISMAPVIVFATILIFRSVKTILPKKQSSSAW